MQTNIKNLEKLLFDIKDDTSFIEKVDFFELDKVIEEIEDQINAI